MTDEPKIKSANMTLEELNQKQGEQIRELQSKLLASEARVKELEAQRGFVLKDLERKDDQLNDLESQVLALRVALEIDCNILQMVWDHGEKGITVAELGEALEKSKQALSPSSPSTIESRIAEAVEKVEIAQESLDELNVDNYDDEDVRNVQGGVEDCFKRLTEALSILRTLTSKGSRS